MISRHVAWIGLAFLVGCGASSTPPSATHEGDYPYKIVASVGMVADVARHVAGEHAEVVGLIGEGVDPHQHSPTRQDMRELLDADVVVYSGLMLEGRMTDSFDDLRDSGRRVIAMTDAIDSDELIQPTEEGAHADPHIWMDVALWRQCSLQLAEQLAEYDPAHADEYRSNAKSFAEELDKLDQYVKDAVETVPEQQRLLITAHDAFGYFGRAYGIEVMAPQGISTEAEASVEDINLLVRTIVERKVAAIFVESSVNPKSIQAIIEGAADRDHSVTVGGTLFSDAMGAKGTYEGTYIGMLDHNATVIVNALGGDVSPSGMNGRLSLATGSSSP